MDVKRLNYFVHVAELGSFTKAGIVLGLEQSVLSRHVRALEQEFGIKLLHRDGRGVSVTDAGELLLERSRVVLGELSRLSSELSSLTADPSGTFKLGVPSSISPELLVPVIVDASRKYPKVSIEIAQAPGNVIQQSLMDGELDVALLYELPTSRNIIAEKVQEECLVLVGRSGSIGSSVSGTDLAMLRDVTLALPRRAHGIRAVLDNAARRAGVALSPLYEADDIDTLKAIVEQAGCYTVLCPSMLQRETDAKRFDFVEIGPQPIYRVLLLTASSKFALSGPGEFLYQRIKRHLEASVPMPPGRP